MKKLNAAWRPAGDEFKEAKAKLEEMAKETTPFIQSFSKEYVKQLEKVTLDSVNTHFSAFLLKGLQPLRELFNPPRASYFNLRAVKKALASLRHSTYLSFLIIARVDPKYQNILRKWLATVDSVSAIFNKYFQNKPSTRSQVAGYCSVMRENLQKLLEIIPFVE